MNLLTKHPRRNPPLATLILAHGAGAPMDSEWMNQLTALLVQKSIRVVRFEFPYMSRRRSHEGRPPPNPAPVLIDCWKDAINSLRNASPPLFIGGKSMGGRIASMIANESDIAGLICLGYPMRPMGKAINDQRLQPLREISRPTLILQGERDSLGSFDELAAYPFPPCLQTKCIPSGDHSFKPLKRSGRTLEQNLELAANCATDFITRYL